MTPLLYSLVEVNRGGKKLHIRVHQITDDWIDPVVDHMVSYFIPREPISSYLNLMGDPESLTSLKYMWRQALKEGAGVVATLEEDNRTIVGANVTCISSDSYGDDEMLKGEAFLKIMDTLNQMTEEGDLHKKYGCDKYLTALGLSVHPDYNGLGLGYEIVKVRDKICALLGLTMSATIFTGPASQRIASKCGYEVLSDNEYKSYTIKGQRYYENLPGTCKLMARTYL